MGLIGGWFPTKITKEGVELDTVMLEPRLLCKLPESFYKFNPYSSYIDKDYVLGYEGFYAKYDIVHHLNDGILCWKLGTPYVDKFTDISSEFRGEPYQKFALMRFPVKVIRPFGNGYINQEHERFIIGQEFQLLHRDNIYCSYVVDDYILFHSADETNPLCSIKLRGIGFRILTRMEILNRIFHNERGTCSLVELPEGRSFIKEGGAIVGELFDY